MAEAEKVSMLARKDWRVLAAAVVLGAISVVLMNVYVRSREKAEVLETVVVASTDIPSGTPVSRGLLTTKEVPRGALGGGYITGNELDNFPVGRGLSVRVNAGQPVYWNFITTLPTDTSLDRFLRYDLQERAFLMQFSGQSAGAVMPGDLIDILGTYSEGGVAKAFQLLPAVTVIQQAGSGLWLSVKPEEALLLTVARSTCQPTFILRSKKETTKDTDLAPVSATDILPRAKQLSAERIQRGPRIVREQ